jgi:hypothetical protein
MAALFVLSMAVQYNDPDPFVWMLAYAVPASLCVTASLDRLAFRLAAVSAIAYATLAVYWLPSVLGVSVAALTHIGMDSQQDEEAREGLGLLIAAVWLSVMAAWTARTKRGRDLDEAIGR